MNKNDFVKSKYYFLFLAYSMPIMSVLFLICYFGVNIPYWDEWSLTNFFHKVASNTISFQDFYSQSNEHRILFPKLILFSLTLISKWNTKLLMYLSLVMVIVSFILLCKISFSVANRSKERVYQSNILMCLLLFSLTQWENWLWGFQIAWFLINLCVILGVFFLTIPNFLHLKVKIFLSAICCFVASFSSAHGLLTWLALIPSILSIKTEKSNQKINILLTWLSLFFVCTFLYLVDYKKPESHPSIIFSFEQLGTRLAYLLTIIGSPFAIFPALKLLVGFILLALFLTFNFSFLRQYKSGLNNDFAPWIALSWYSVLFAIMTTLGRGGFGIVQATSSRYSTPIILLYISILQLCYLSSYTIQEKIAIKNRFILKISTLFFIGFLSFCLLTSSAKALHSSKNSMVQRSQGKFCLESISVNVFISSEQKDCLSLLYPNPDELVKNFILLKQLNLR